MLQKYWLFSFCIIALIFLFNSTTAESPYRYFEWHVTYGYVSPLGVQQQGILINNQFPGPDLIAVTNDNLVINVFNDLDESFLLTWDGIRHRKNSYEDGVYGTTCPIPPGKNFTFNFQLKDQIGTYFYSPSTAFHKVTGGFGGIRVLRRPLIPVPFPPHADDFTFLIGDWYKSNHKQLKKNLDDGMKLPFPDGIHINGRKANDVVITVEKGKTYRFRISNVGVQCSLNIRFQGHQMKLIEIEGTHTIQQLYSSIDVHLGQSFSVLVTTDQDVQNFYIAISTRFTEIVHTTTAILHYKGSSSPVSGPPPSGPTTDIEWSIAQARNLSKWTKAKPTTYHYGQIPLNRTIRLGCSSDQLNGKLRYAVNSVSFIPADTPLKLADYFNITGVFRVNSIPDHPTGEKMHLDTGVLGGDYKTFVEIVFENNESIVQTWHVDGYNFYVVGMDGGEWSSEKRKQYNLHDAIARCTVQVYPKSWTAVYVALDNAGMWNIRTQNWERQYLGQQLYLRVYTPSKSLRDEYLLPDNALLCGRAHK